jgi:hypothetical protein
VNVLSHAREVIYSQFRFHFVATLVYNASPHTLILSSQRRSVIGITIRYRGRLADLSRVEDFEDRLLDLALDLGGQAQIWRSSAEGDSARIVRGVILNQAPGQESTSLLISPEGWLIGLIEIEDAELGRLSEPPWCFVKTQFGPLEGHVALVEIFAALKREFIPDLEVSDEGGYWETRDLERLSKNFTTLQMAIDGMAEGLRAHGLSAEAAEDPEILIHRIARIAEKVRQSLGRPAEHAPLSIPDEEDEFGDNADSAETEAAWDEMYKHSRRTQERLQRYLQERLARGEAYDAAFEGALKDAGLTNPDDLLSDDDDEVVEPFAADFDWSEDDDADFESDDEDDHDDDFGGEDEDADEERRGDAEGASGSSVENDKSTGAEADIDFPDRERHPLLERASQFWMRLHNLFQEKAPADEFSPKTPKTRVSEATLRTLFDGAGDLCGGLAQALTHPEDFPSRGLCIVQLKRALRGLAFARGGLCNVSVAGAVPTEVVKAMQATLDELETEVFQELARARESK